MRHYIIALLILSVSMSTNAHDGGHGHFELWIIKNRPFLAEFLKLEDQKVFLLNEEKEIVECTLSDFSPKYQEVILSRHEQIVSVNRLSNQPDLNYQNIQGFLMALSVGLFMLGLIWFFFKRRNQVVALMFLASGMILFITACRDDSDQVPSDNGGMEGVPPNDIAFLTSLFESFSTVTTASDTEWFYIQSDGLAEHEMMTGITNWQQQVPIDQDFTGENRWQIPIQPIVADEVLPMEDQFFRNAIGIAVNGVPLYHPMTNAGVDAFASGQLDQWYGHSGRADDYHYHIPPIHLESTVGADNPVAYALDGFPIYGATTETLDDNLGRFNDEGGYQYHTMIDQYPYFMANLVGKVTYTETIDGQNTVYEITPQPRTEGARPSTDPLGGTLEITNFENTGTNSYELTYLLNSETYRINYSWDNSGLYTYVFTNPDGSSATETYQR